MFLVPMFLNENTRYCRSNKGGSSGLVNDTLNTFYLRIYGVGLMVKDDTNKRGTPLPPHWLLFLISSKGYFICTIPQTG